LDHRAGRRTLVPYIDALLANQGDTVLIRGTSPVHSGYADPEL
jgi:hypothetical protein